MHIVFSILPVFLFLTGLFLLDSFKLVSKNRLALCILWGVISALISYYLNSWLNSQLDINFAIFSRYLAPITEELSKILIVLFLIDRKKIGFAVDAAVYGFAAGAGFALAENIFYLYALGHQPGMVVWILRGFGTALMHGGCTAIFAIILIDGIQRDRKLFLAAIPGFLTAFILHSGFNHFFLNPYIQTALIFLVLPLVFMLVFQKSNSSLQDWLEIEFSQEVEMLGMMQQGRFAHTKAGNYLLSLRKHFNSEAIVDLYNYISLYLELSIKAKRNMMLKENGFPVIVEPDIGAKLEELKQVRKQIGKIGELALQPLVRMKHREIWKLNQLKK